MTKDGIDGNKTYAKLFHAVRNAAIQTHALILVHLDIETDAIEIINFFKEKAVKSRLILCHLDRARYDFVYHKEIAAEGVFLEYDTINRPKYHSDEDEIKLILYMIEQGFADRLLLEMDTTNKRMKSYGTDFGLNYILIDFKDKLLKSGLSLEEFNDMMITNSANALAF